MNTRREFLRQIAFGAGAVALTPQVFASPIDICKKHVWEDQIAQVSKDTFDALKNWFDCTEEELLLRIMAIVREGIYIQSNGEFDSAKDEFVLEIPHWNVLKGIYSVGLPEYTLEYDIQACYPNCTIKHSLDGYARAKWKNLEAHIG